MLYEIHHLVFVNRTFLNPFFVIQSSTSVGLYIGNWGGSSGTIWIDNFSIAEYPLFNVVQRDGAPFRGIHNHHTPNLPDPANSTIPFSYGLQTHSGYLAFSPSLHCYHVINNYRKCSVWSCIRVYLQSRHWLQSIQRSCYCFGNT